MLVDTYSYVQMKSFQAPRRVSFRHGFAMASSPPKSSLSLLLQPPRGRSAHKSID